uniref:HAT C-terminal dimerisation domain-containing protein n=1 Tax=Cyprinus carpio TaxID=7962 RepID=A0A8C2HJN4_CYPCA
LPKSKKRACTFNDDLQKEFKFLKRESLSEASKLRCDICGARFSIAHGGRADITQHMHTKKHMDAAKSKCATPSVSEFFVKQSCESDKVHASEGLFAYHSVIHGHSFRSADCTAKFIKKLYDPKFSSSRTKSETIKCNVLGPLSEEEVQHDLYKCSFVTLTVEASNHKDIKLFPVLVRYFKPLEGIKVKITELSSLPGETSDLQTAYISHVIEKHGLAQKIVALCVDNTNTNFGGVKRAGKGNIWRKLQIQLGRDILGIGCNFLSCIGDSIARQYICHRSGFAHLSFFIPSDIKTQLDTLVKAGDIKADDFYCAVRSFYSASVDYFDNWSCSLENTKELEWVLLRSFPEWRDIQSSLSNFYSKIPALTSVDKTMLFDEWACAKNIVTCHIIEWNKNKVAVSDRWRDVFSEMGSKSLNFGVLSLAVEFVLCLPGTSAPVERVFSLMNASWTDEKSRQSVTTMKAMLFVRINFGLDCSAFYDKLLKDKRTLAKIGSSEKYKTATVNDAVAPSCSH